MKVDSHGFLVMPWCWNSDWQLRAVVLLFTSDRQSWLPGSPWSVHCLFGSGDLMAFIMSCFWSSYKHCNCCHCCCHCCLKQVWSLMLFLWSRSLSNHDNRLQPNLGNANVGVLAHLGRVLVLFIIILACIGVLLSIWHAADHLFVSFRHSLLFIFSIGCCLF